MMIWRFVSKKNNLSSQYTIFENASAQTGHRISFSFQGLHWCNIAPPLSVVLSDRVQHRVVGWSTKILPLSGEGDTRRKKICLVVGKKILFRRQKRIVNLFFPSEFCGMVHSIFRVDRQFSANTSDGELARCHLPLPYFQKVRYHNSRCHSRLRIDAVEWQQSRIGLETALWQSCGRQLVCDIHWRMQWNLLVEEHRWSWYGRQYVLASWSESVWSFWRVAVSE